MLVQGNVNQNAASTSTPPGSTSAWSEVNRTETFSTPTLFLKKRFTSAWLKKQTANSDGDGEEGVRGPLGLRLLHHSPEPLIDLIFVHGLRGGSVKTWRKGNDPRNFWPKFWLPVEPGLQNANIHSFGYDSDWASTKSSFLDVHDFGQSLLEEMRNSPYLRDDQKRPIMLLGHSMGGLVIKKAFILAKDVPGFQERIRCIFFLATPHRGSDYAALLNNILAVSGVLSPRHYITDLVAGSTSAQLINEDFGRHASDLPVFSFYETLRMSIGISSFLIVNRSSAILVIQSKMEESKEQMMLLKTFLGIPNSPDEDYPRAEGTCLWIDDRDDYQEWRDSAGSLFQDDAPESAKNPSVLLVHASPGTGKTFLAAHVKEQLCQLQLECASYFFHVGNNTSHTLENFIRSIAYQMASLNASIREKLLEIYYEQSTFDKDDIWTLWTKVFKKGIFQARIRTSQYWVVDAMDECSRYRNFFTMIKGVQLSFPLRIFITSRKLPDMSHLTRSLEPLASVTSFEIKTEDTVRDIECYIQTRIRDRPTDATVNMDDLVSNLLLRSNACFLWVKLVLDELEQVYSNDKILEVFHEIPETMIPYYERAIRAMAEKKREKNIAKAVLVWVVASTRKLLISELSHALKLDINADIPNTRNAVEGLCGQLVSVNHHSGVVDLVHSTVREFLFSEAAAEFTMSMPEAHERIALACLQLLCSPEMQPPRSQRQLTPQPQHAKKEPGPSPLLDYAIRQFSEHVYLASSATDELLPSLDRFFERNVLRWIEKFAQEGNLHPLIRFSKNLKGYLNRRSKYRSTLSVEPQNLQAWSTDMSMIVTKFGPALLEKPSSIYILIPSLCPSGSAIHHKFGKRLDGLTVVGHIESAWDECIASVSFGEETIPATVSCRDDLIGVGMESGEINLYDNRSCQKVGVISGKRSIDLVHLTDRLIAVTTTKDIILMDREGKILWQKRLNSRCMLLTSTPQAIIAVSQPGHVLKWDISTGVLLEDKTFAYMCLDYEGEAVTRMKAPHVATLSLNSDMLALGYSDGTVCMWEVSSKEVICWARDDENRTVSALLFNPNPVIDILLVIYSDHHLALYETWSGSLVNTRKPPSDNTGVMSTACSLDGKTLATVDNSGFLRIWDFKSLTLLCHLLIPYAPFRILNFTPDASGVVDITDSGMRVWAPATLVRRNNEEMESFSEDEVNLYPIEGTYEMRRASKITALYAHPYLPIVFAGKQDGQVLAFSTKTGKQIAQLHTHAHAASISNLAMSNNHLLASYDTNDRLQVWKLGSGQLSTFEDRNLNFQLQLPVRAVQLCFSEHGDHLLVSTENEDTVYCMEDGSCVGTLQFSARERKVWRWLAAPTSQDQKDEFCLVMDHTMVKYSAHEFPERVTDSQVQLNYSVEDGTEAVKIDSAVICPSTQTLALSIRHASGPVTPSTLFLFDLSKLVSYDSLDKVSSLTPICGSLSKNCKQFIGINEGTKSFVFLHQNSWICSISPDGLSEGRFTQHFFVPNDG
ncbi:Vegetative incompatibility protein HET-E-1 [Cytospora mali]|uniref:Vegetative incompatibility protein HET-E-1 n=1 Tax=Cytospora mali TaxID=578113 RepID=A0A194UNC2_CYTMA|nr:Vegetative incompatibility protein HET-E-1 [Valsa mali var. pyri (nom. inval.)]